MPELISEIEYWLELPEIQEYAQHEAEWLRCYKAPLDVYDQEQDPADDLDGYAQDLGWIDWPHIRIAVLIMLSILGLLILAIPHTQTS
jgi:hypothetical protein